MQSISRAALESAIKNRDEHTILGIGSTAIEATQAHLREHVKDILAKVRAESGQAAADRLVKELKTARGNGSNQYGSKGETKDANKESRAKASHVAVTSRTRAMAAESEKMVAKMIGGKRMEEEQHNHPVDVTKGKAAIEMKTMTTNSNDKITMHPKSLDRKQGWVDKNGFNAHTVIIDKRDVYSKQSAKNYSGHQMYHREGFGSFRLAGMTRVKNAAHLRRLLKG